MIKMNDFTKEDVKKIMDIINKKGTSDLRLREDTTTKELFFIRGVDGFFEKKKDSTSCMAWIEDIDTNQSLLKFMKNNNFYSIEISKRNGRVNNQISIVASSYNYDLAYFYTCFKTDLIEALQDLGELGTK